MQPLAMFFVLVTSMGIPGLSGTEPAAEPACPLCTAADKADTDEPVAATLDPESENAHAYLSAPWPEHNSGEGLYANDFQGQKLPRALGNETWISEREDFAGRVMVIGFWATWSGPCREMMPGLVRLQRDHPGGLAVATISGIKEDEQTVRAYLRERELWGISHLFDARQTLYRAFESRGTPLVVIVSTDGVVRWIGNPLQETFRGAVEQVMRADPLLNPRG
ncbi:MAG: TlpA disulfide reductase family protein [Phycisphaerales bacterium]